MFNGKSFLAIIPARGGSKRLPKKNILELHKKPLINWTVESAINCSFIDKIVVTSDDDDILNVVKDYAIDIIKRPNELATDKSTTFDVIKHVIDNYEKFDFIILLQPTSPLRNHIHIEEAVYKLFEKKADAIVSVSEVEHSPLWSNTLPIDDNMSNFISEKVLNKRSQDLEIFYRLNGAIYICRTNNLLEERSFILKSNIYAYKMEKESSVDIDVEFDFKLAELLKGEVLEK